MPLLWMILRYFIHCSHLHSDAVFPLFFLNHTPFPPHFLISFDFLCDMGGCATVCCTRHVRMAPHLLCRHHISTVSAISACPSVWLYCSLLSPVYVVFSTAIDSCFLFVCIICSTFSLLFFLHLKEGLCWDFPFVHFQRMPCKEQRQQCVSFS